MCIHITANDSILFLFMSEEYSIVYIHHTFIHPSIDGLCPCSQGRKKKLERSIRLLGYGSTRVGLTAPDLAQH